MLLLGTPVEQTVAGRLLVGVVVKVCTSYGGGRDIGGGGGVKL